MAQTVTLDRDLARVEKALAYLRKHDDGSAESYDVITGLLVVRNWLKNSLEVA